MKCGCGRRVRDLRRAVAADLRAVFGHRRVRRRSPQESAWGPDVTAPGLAIACVRARRTSARAALHQAATQGGQRGALTVAVCKDDGERPYVAMAFEDFLDLLADWHALKALREATVES
jgi:hypothetical protein